MIKTNKRIKEAIEALDYCQNYIKGSAYEKYSNYDVLKKLLNYDK